MNDINSKLILNIEINNPDLISELNIIAMELSLTLDVFIQYSLNKTISDIKFVRSLRNLDKSKEKNAQNQI